MSKEWISNIEEQDMGFEAIPVCRPRFIFFDFDGLKPDTAYWVFFNQVDVTNYVNTTYNLNSLQTADRKSPLRDPGEKYKNATGFPADLGGPTGTPLYSDSTGSLEGAFFLQSNDSLSFPAGKLQLSVMDISVFNPEKALSHATVVYTADGQYNNYTEVDNGYWKNIPAKKTKKTKSSGGSSSSSKSSSSKSKITPPSGSSVDLPGNAISRLLGIGEGGDYMKGKGKYKGTTDADRKKDKAGSGKNSNTGDGCVIATYAQTMNSDLLDLREKKKAEDWCIKTYHDKWWGEAIRRGYRHFGRGLIASGNADKYFQQFIDYVSFGRGDKRTAKTFFIFTCRTIQFFVLGLTIARKEK